jgi:adenosylcobinamide-phosphate synthase
VTFWAMLLALVWDQVAPLFRPSQWDHLYGRGIDWLHDRVNAGSQGHGLLAWVVAVLLPGLVVGLIGYGLAALAWPLGLAWSAAVLYRCLGYRQLVDLARSLADTLGEPHRADDKLALLGIHRAGDDDQEALLREVMDRLFRLGVQRLFGVLFWFALLGEFGAAVYALTQLLADRWRGDEAFHSAIASMTTLFDWLPERLLAISFALVGNFEEAMLAWRTCIAEGGHPQACVVRTAGLGALGVANGKLGPEYVSGLAGLLNRALLLWIGTHGLFWLGGV